MKHKTSELEGALLDAAVAKAEMAIDDAPPLRGRGEARSMREWRITDADLGREHVRAIDWKGNDFVFGPSAFWEDGGPIIEREQIQLVPIREASVWQARTRGGHHVRTGPTPLIAAMRAYVASKFGDEVEL